MFFTKSLRLKRSFRLQTGITLMFALAFACLHACSDGPATMSKKSNDSANAKLDSMRKAFKNHDLSIIFLTATSQLLQCQLLLESTDGGGQMTGPADSLIVNSKKGDTLYQAISKMYDVGVLYATNETDKARFAAMKEPADSKQWLQKNFKGVSTVEAENRLSRIQNDCTLINRLAPH